MFTLNMLVLPIIRSYQLYIVNWQAYFQKKRSRDIQTKANWNMRWDSGIGIKHFDKNQQTHS